MSKNEPIQKIEDADNLFASKKETNFGVNANLANEQGAPLCNTAPPKYNGTQILRSGVDSLYLSFNGDVRSGLLSQLQDKKALAQAGGHSGKAFAALGLAGIPFKVHAKGQNMHPFVISNHHFRMRIAGSQAGKVPPLYVEISSELLSCCGYESSVQAAREFAEAILNDADSGSISRIDLCVDFTSSIDWQSVDAKRWRCRSNHRALYLESEQLLGNVFGQSGDVSARLYDKTKEIVKSEKFFFKELWQQNGWDGESSVWRLEFQLRREALKTCQSLNPDFIIELFNSLWRYYTTQWLSLCNVNPKDSNRSRWPLAAEWQTLSTAKFNPQPVEDIRRLNFESVPSDETIFVGATGYLTSFMVKYEYKSLAEALTAYPEHAKRYFKTAENKHISFDAYVEKKVAEKKVKFVKLGKLLESEK
ncbi:hypothetical protein [Pseudidiomarina sp. CB1]|uniref:hypothetical protein n=1 Tax=Pseudidiomarina sp. CB1 TaxID=2972484 RepID=UPI0021637200|nr:hypothetical protein [Pseudidiomarina sp. CB1]